MKPDLAFATLRAYLTMYAFLDDPLAHLAGPVPVSLRATWRSVKECNAADQEFGAPNDDRFHVPAWRVRFPGAAAALDVVRGIVASAACDLFGHHYEDTGCYAGPEGAAEHFTCSRCGAGFRHTYF